MTRTSLVALAFLWLAAPAAVAETPAAVAPSDVPPGWLAAVQRDIAAREYAFSAAGEGAFSAPNRAKDLRSRVAAEGVSVVSRTAGDQAFHIELYLARAGREGSLADVPAGIAELRGARVEIRREGPRSSSGTRTTSAASSRLTVSAPEGARAGRRSCSSWPRAARAPGAPGTIGQIASRRRRGRCEAALRRPRGVRREPAQARGRARGSWAAASRSASPITMRCTRC
jgi:hypothetical protein